MSAKYNIISAKINTSVAESSSLGGVLYQKMSVSAKLTFENENDLGGWPRRLIGRKCGENGWLISWLG